MFVLMRQLFALALRHLPCSVLGCAVVITMLACQGVSAQSVQQGQPASFTLRPEKGNCTRVTGYGSHFPPGSTVNIEGPSMNGHEVSTPDDMVEITKQVAADGTFTATFKPCPRQLV